MGLELREETEMVRAARLDHGVARRSNEKIEMERERERERESGWGGSWERRANLGGGWKWGRKEVENFLSVTRLNLLWQKQDLLWQFKTVVIGHKNLKKIIKKKTF